MLKYFSCLMLSLWTTVSCLAFCAAFSAPALAQDASDIYVVKVQATGEDAVVGQPVRLTDRDGYDNQPSFSAEGKRLYYTSMRATSMHATATSIDATTSAGDASGQQSDIWVIDLDGTKPLGAPRALFETPESEYSPTVIPGHEALSVVRVEADQEQRLWRLPLDGSPPSVILPELRPVGYHAWDAAGEQLVLFVLDEPKPRLVRVSALAPRETERTVASDIGRALHQIPGEDAFSFIDKAADGRTSGWRVARLSIEGDQKASLVRMPEGREDVAWSPDGSLWSGDASRLLRWRPGDSDWQEVADLGRYGIAGITRLAFDAGGGRLALVAARPPEKVRRLDIVERAIAHHGGERYASSDTSLKLCSRSGCFDIRARVDGGNYLFDVRGEVRGGSGVVAQRVRVTNDAVELWRDGKPTPIAEGEEKPLRDWAMARVYFPFLPYRLDDPSVWKQDLGLESWNGRQLHKVRVSFDQGSSTDAGDVYLYWFDEESAQLVLFAYSFSGSPGGLRFRELENERRVGGLLFFDQKNYGAEGEGLTVERLSADSVRDLKLVSTVTAGDISVQALDRIEDPTPENP